MLSFEEIEDCFPEYGGTTDNGAMICSAQWLHDFARKVASKEREAFEVGMKAALALATEGPYEAGWATAANWMGRDDLIADIGSPAYLADREKALKE